MIIFNNKSLEQLFEITNYIYTKNEGKLIEKCIDLYYEKHNIKMSINVNLKKLYDFFEKKDKKNGTKNLEKYSLFANKFIEILIFASKRMTKSGEINENTHIYVENLFLFFFRLALKVITDCFLLKHIPNKNNTLVHYRYFSQIFSEIFEMNDFQTTLYLNIISGFFSNCQFLKSTSEIPSFQCHIDNVNINILNQSQRRNFMKDFNILSKFHLKCILFIGYELSKLPNNIYDLNLFFESKKFKNLDDVKLFFTDPFYELLLYISIDILKNISNSI